MKFKGLISIKLYAFTLVEMLVVMLIMSVISILSYYLFIALFQKSAMQGKFQNQIEKIVLAEKTFAYHLQHADYAQIKGEEDLFVVHKLDTLHFQLKKEMVLFLSPALTDTLLKGSMTYTKQYEPLLLRQQILKEFSFTFTDAIGLRRVRNFTIHNSAKVMMHLDSIYNLNVY